MNEDVFNASIRKFLKTLGVTAQREIEKAVRDAVAKGRFKPLRGLRGQRDLRHEYDRARTFPNDARDGLDVDVRLPACGNAVEECCAKSLCVECPPDPM